MRADQIVYLLQQLTAAGLSFDAGLREEEVKQVERVFKFRFPPDLRAFLQTALPADEEFVPWRQGIRDEKNARQLISRSLQEPIEGLVFEAKAGRFWLPQWGELPTGQQQREQLVRQQLAGCPPLIPIYSHRYLPAWPHEAGNPVFSVHGSDITYYGYDLFSYFLSEFTLRCPPGSQIPDRPKPIAFWGDFDEPKHRIEWGYWDGQEEIDA